RSPSSRTRPIYARRFLWLASRSVNHPAETHMTELIGIPYSPWSEKARWALDVRRVPYVSRLYKPLVGEPMLRLALRRWRGAVSVPVLREDNGRMLADSLAIA